MYISYAGRGGLILGSSYAFCAIYPCSGCAARCDPGQRKGKITKKAGGVVLPVFLLLVLFCNGCGVFQQIAFSKFRTACGLCASLACRPDLLRVQLLYRLHCLLLLHALSLRSGLHLPASALCNVAGSCIQMYIVEEIIIEFDFIKSILKIFPVVHFCKVAAFVQEN